MRTLIVFGFLLCATAVVNAGYDDPVKFQCPSSQILNYIGSVHDNHHEDRLFFFGCRATPLQLGSSYWTSWLNNFDETFSHLCPTGQVVTGQESYHDNGKEDRRFRLKCTQMYYHHSGTCYWTSYTAYDAVWKLNVPDLFYIRGMKSHHSNSKEDRQFSFYLCKYW